MQSIQVEKQCRLTRCLAILLLSGMMSFLWSPPTKARERIIINQVHQVLPMKTPIDDQESLGTLPDHPPTNDPEMVIKPDVPAPPGSVVDPPVIDPEMALDPATREPMTREELESLQMPDHERRKEFHGKK